MTLKKIFILALIILSLYPLLKAGPETGQEASEVMLKEIEPFAYICVPHKGPFTDMEKVIGMLMQAIQNQSISPLLGPMIGIYYNSPEQVKPEELIWEIGFPVAPHVMPLAPLEKKQWTFTTVSVSIHVGPYEKTGETINKMMDWMKANGYIPAGPVMEIYLTEDPSKVKQEELKTEIRFPCKKLSY